MDPKYYIKVLLKRKYLVIAVCLISAITTFILLKYKNKEYISKAQLATGITNNEEVSVTQIETNWNIINNKFNNFIEFMSAKEIYSLLMYELMLHDLNSPVPFRPLEIKKIKTRLSAAQLQKTNKMLQAKYDSMQVLFLDNDDEASLFELIKEMKYDIKSIKKILSFSRIPNTDYIKLECKTEDANLSAFIVNKYTEETIRFFKYGEMMRLGTSVSFFEELAKKKKIALDSNTNRLENFKNKSQLIDYKVQSEAKLDQIAALEQAKNDETKKIRSLKNAIKQADYKLNVKDDNKNNNFDSKHLNSDITSLQTRISNLNRQYVVSGMKDSKILDSVNVLKQKLDDQVSRFSHESFPGVGNLKEDLLAKKLNYEIDLSMSEASLDYINSTLHELKSEISQLAVNETALIELDMAVNVAKEEYLTMVNKYNTVKNISLSNTENLKQIEFGQPADAPEPSKQMLFTIVSAIACLLLSSTIILLLVYFDKSIKTPTALTKVTKLNTIGYLSHIKAKNIDLKSIFSDSKASKDLVKVKEQLRKLRYEIESSGAKVFLFTSTKESEGKSFTLFSLAYSLSLNSKKILIIDTNFKNNTLTKMCKGNEIIEKYLLTEKNKLLTEGNITTDALTQTEATDTEISPNFSQETTTKVNVDLISHTEIEGVDIIGCKNNQLSPSEVFYGRDFKKMLNEVSKNYDIIFMEGAALNLYADTRELSIYADKMIAVFSANSVIKEVDKESIAFLQSDKEKFLGAILNNMDPENLEL